MTCTGSNARQSHAREVMPGSLTTFPPSSHLRSFPPPPDPIPLLDLTFASHLLSPWYNFKRLKLFLCTLSCPSIFSSLLQFPISWYSLWAGHPSTHLRFLWGQEGRTEVDSTCGSGLQWQPDFKCCVLKQGRLVVCRPQGKSPSPWG